MGSPQNGRLHVIGRFQVHDIDIDVVEILQMSHWPLHHGDGIGIGGQLGALQIDVSIDSFNHFDVRLIRLFERLPGFPRQRVAL